MGNGNATFDLPKNRYFVNLNVTAKYDATAAADTPRWRKAFEYASQILFEATNGQMQLGKIFFLDNGVMAGSDDVGLQPDGVRSSTNQGPLAFDGQISLVARVMNEPVVAVHELGHYIALLGEEYVYYGSTFRVCQGNSATLQCIMEFGGGFGLRLDNLGNPSITQPLHNVHQFCYLGHQNNIGNDQHLMHGESCWHTIQRIYNQLSLPGGAASTNAIEALEWIERSESSKFALVIPSSPEFAAPQVQRAVKSAAKQLIHRVAQSGDQLAILMGPQGVLYPMSHVTLEVEDALFHLVDQANLSQASDANLAVSLATEQFHGVPGAYQVMFLVGSGNSKLDTQAVEARLNAKRITMIARTFGRGDLGSKLDLADLNSKWIEHESIPAPLPQLSNYAFALQNELIQTSYTNTPGYAAVDMRSGRLPAVGKTSVLNLLPQSEWLDAIPVDEINLEQRDRGVDFAVWIEDGAEAVTFLLSQPIGGNIAFSLIAPNGQEITRPATIGALPSNIVAFDLTDRLTGRWIVRLRRKSSTADLPFFVMTAVKNRRLLTVAEVTVNEARRVKLRSQLIVNYPLDGIQVTVEIVPLLPDAAAPGEILASLVLHRQQTIDPVTGHPVQLSTGWYEGETILPPGAYIATFRWVNHGQAIYASNSSGQIHGATSTLDLGVIPALSRVESRRFNVH